MRREKVMVTLFLVLTLAGCLLLFLTHPNQRWLHKPLTVMPWRWLGVAFVLAGLFSAVSYLPVNAALFAWLVIMMLVIGLLPFAALLKEDGGEKHRGH